MTGLGFLEARTISLSNDPDQLGMMGRDSGSGIEIENPISVEHTTIRLSAIPSLMRLLSANKHRDLPQRLFEVADVMVNARNRVLLSGVSADAKASFTEIKGVVQRILSDLNVPYTIGPVHVGCYIRGRSGACLVEYDGADEGPFREISFEGRAPLVHFGEISPTVISGCDLVVPVSAFELDLSLLERLRDNPR